MKHLMVCMFIAIGMTYSHAQTERFITIIGPDGFPMVVPYIEKTTKEQTVKKKENKTFELQQPKQQVDIVPVEQVSFASQQQIKVPVNIKSMNEPMLNTLQAHDSVIVVENHMIQNAKKQLPQKDLISSSQEVVRVKEPSIIDVPTDLDLKEESADKMRKSLSSTDFLIEKKSDMQSQANTKSPYILMEGEKYYDAEYLEENEFNLEGKSRFYQIPMSGNNGSQWNIIERKKGVDMSWFNWRNQAEKATQQEAIALGEYYQVLGADVLQEMLPTRCVDHKVLKKSKLLKNGIVSFWPRAPIKEDFDFELLSLNQNKVQNFKITSFAKTEKNESYYWPLVIFLDQQGCVIEGVTGYFTKAQNATTLQRQSIEGVVQLPENTYYVLFTPLESSADVTDKKLANEGQMILTILR